MSRATHKKVGRTLTIRQMFGMVLGRALADSGRTSAVCAGGAEAWLVCAPGLGEPCRPAVAASIVEPAIRPCAPANVAPATCGNVR